MILYRLKVKPEVLESFRSVVKTKLQGGKNTKETTQSVQYKGPSLSVSAIQVFKEDVYVCYNGSELRRFNLKVICYAPINVFPQVGEGQGDSRNTLRDYYTAKNLPALRNFTDH